LLTYSKVAVSESQQMGFLLIGLDKVLYLINRCTIYEILYLRALDPMEGLENFQLALVKLYAIILQSLCKAIRQFDKDTASRAFHAFWNLDDVTDFEKNCKAQEEQVEIAAEACERFYNRNVQEEGARSIKELKHMLEGLKEQNELLNQVDTRVTALWNKSNQIEHSKILYWTSDIPYRDHHELARTGRTAGTGEWLLEHGQYQEWLSLDESMILWVHGIRKSSLHASE
jgi:ankyrin repeat domain-containing protein 50